MPRGDRRECLWCNPVDLPPGSNDTRSKLHGIATPVCPPARDDVFSFRRYFYCQLYPLRRHLSTDNRLLHKVAPGLWKKFSALPNPLPRGEGGPKGRERNSGGNLQARTTSQTFTRGATKTALWCRSSHFQNHYVAAHIPHQSGNRFRRADSLTARNCGVIAPGNHWILDSLRGAPPPGEAMGAAAPEKPL